MISVIYVSVADPLIREEDIAAILLSARRNNRRDGLTGALIYNGHNFMQLLEGPAREIDACLDTIRGDARHSGMVEVRRRAIDVREFAEWSSRPLDVIYPVIFVDAIVFNTIEFFSGKNPMLGSREELGGGHSLAFSADGPDAVRVEHFERGQRVRAFRLERQGDAVVLSDHRGRALATARELPGGAVEVRTTRGDVRAALEPTARARVEAAIQAGKTPGEALLG